MTYLTPRGLRRTSIRPLQWLSHSDARQVCDLPAANSSSFVGSSTRHGQSRMSLTLVNRFLDLRYCLAQVTVNHRLTVIHHRLDKIPDQRRVQICIGWMRFAV